MALKLHKTMSGMPSQIIACWQVKGKEKLQREVTIDCKMHNSCKSNIITKILFRVRNSKIAWYEKANYPLVVDRANESSTGGGG